MPEVKEQTDELNHPSRLLTLRWHMGNVLRFLQWKVREIRGRVPVERGWRWFYGVFILMRLRDLDEGGDCDYFENISARGHSPMACDGFGHPGCQFCRHFKKSINQ